MVEMESQDVLSRGDAAPPFELQGTDGRSHSLSDLSDYEAVLLVFTCNHCPYAQAKFDELNRLAAEFDSLAVVGINPNDDEQYPDDSFDRMQELVESDTVAYDAYLRDESQETAAAYGAVCTPDPFLFGRDGGEFSLVYHGRIDDAMDPESEPTEREMANIVGAYLDGSEVTREFRESRGCSIKWREGNEPAYWN